VGGVSLSEMNFLELNFLEMMDFRVHIFPEEFLQYSEVMNSKLSLLKEIYLKNAENGNFVEVRRFLPAIY
jgi:hypothetical protein